MPETKISVEENTAHSNIPKCSLEANEIGSMLWAARATREDTILRAPNAGGPSNARMDGLPTVSEISGTQTISVSKALLSSPATYESGERSTRELISAAHKKKEKAYIPPEADIEPRNGTTGTTFSRKIS
jgi:hypothetical protein